MNKNIIVAASLLLALTFFSPVKSSAMMVETSAAELARLDPARLAQDAKIIVRGEVKSVRSYKGINDVIYTRASVLVSDVIKGKNIKKNITVEYEGGEVGDIGMRVEDEPTLEKGEQVLLFLTNSFWRKNVYYIVGGVLGKYAICTDDTVRIVSSCEEEEDGQERQTLEDLLNEIENAD